jgi:hypothetical protein
VQGVVDVAVFALVRLVVVALIAGDLDPLVVLAAGKAFAEHLAGRRDRQAGLAVDQPAEGAGHRLPA